MRTNAAMFLFPLAFVLAAASPASEIRDKARRAAYEAEGIALCSATMAQGRDGDFEPVDLSQGCRCTVRLLMTGKSVGQLPPLDLANFRTVAKDELAQCLERMSKVGVKRQVSEPAVAETATSDSAAPAVSDPAANIETESPQASEQAAPPPALSEGAGAGGSISAWFAMVPLWAWGAIALGIVLLAGLRRLAGRDSRRDLLGVPPSMRRGGPVRPKRSDPPRRP